MFKVKSGAWTTRTSGVRVRVNEKSRECEDGGWMCAIVFIEQGGVRRCGHVQLMDIYRR